jgi:calcineurin-like phosphoesterase family protein
MMLKKMTFAEGSRVWFTSDTHFGHELTRRQRSTEDRPLPTVEDHDREIVEVWNSVVQPQDHIFHLGDFAYGDCPPPRMRKLFDKLKGKKHLVLGNHDGEDAVALPWATPPEHRRLIQIGKQQLVLDHYAGKTWLGSFHGSLQLYGHSHGNMPATAQSCDVGVDTWDLRPISIHEVRTYLIGRPPIYEQKDEAAEEPTVRTP